MNAHEDCLRRINRLAFENGQLRFYLREAITSMAHAEVFISTREKMHQTGQELWHDLLTRMETCLNEKGERCAECGGALPVTGRNDAMGECSCVVADACADHIRALKNAAPQVFADSSKKISPYEARVPPSPASQSRPTYRRD